MNTQRTEFLVLVAVTQLTLAIAVIANPFHQEPEKSLAKHGDAVSSEAHGFAEKQYKAVAPKLLNYLEATRSNNLKKLDPDQLGHMHLDMTQMRRAGARLSMWGEPSGPDFEMRADDMQSHVSNMIHTVKSLPQGQKYIAAAQAFIAKTAQGRDKALRELEQMCNRREWIAGEKRLNDVYDTLEPWTVFLSQEENRAIYMPFNQVSAAINSAMLEMRSAASKLELTKAVQDTTPKYAEALQEINQAIDGYLTSGAGTWRSEAATGPQLITKIGQVWSETQVVAHQHRGKFWALHLRNGVSDISELDAAANDKLAADFSEFSQAVIKALTRLIEADGSRATIDVARNLYIEYLRALAPLTRQINQPTVTATIQLSLAKFLGKVPELDQEINGYAAATTDLIRWRGRAAQAQAVAQEAEFAPIAQRFHDGTVSSENYVGLFVLPPAQPMQPQLLTHVPNIMPTAVKRLLNQKATVRDVVRIPGESKAAIARYSERTYANVPAPLNIAADTAALKADLLISDQAPAMSLVAMQVVVSADRGDMVAVGGEIVGTHLEGVITRFATLKPVAAILTPLGQLPPERLDGNMLANMLMRFDISPRWVQHDCFFVNLAPSPNQTAAR